MISRKEYQKQWRKDNPEKVIESRKNWRKNNPEKVATSRSRQYQKIKEFIKGYKTERGCAICGYNKTAVALDFHHDKIKECDISKTIRSKSFKRVKEEIEKCIILCANCHRELHENKRGDNY